LRQNQLGRTGIKVSEICYGTLPAGPLQANLAVDAAVEIIRHCFKLGVSFIDTAQRYQTYPIVAKALEGWDKPVVISSKSWATGYEEMRQAVDEARQALGRAPDIFMLHAARATARVFEERAGAFRYLCEAREAGIIRAVGISTHSVEVAQAAATQPEVDVIHPLYNLLGVGILCGDAAAMRAAMEEAAGRGKGMYVMKAMAGGHLADRYGEALDFARAVPGVAALAVGMLSKEEAEANIAHIEGRPISEAVRAKVGKSNKKLYIFDACKGCGACMANCPNGALSLKDNLACVDPERCLLCGYCVFHCPQFALRLV
jgi:aryl-alcohol dehydrogenase-like predicted oxidoreductase/ferredoxin